VNLFTGTMTRSPAHRRIAGGRSMRIGGCIPQVNRYFPGLPKLESGRKSVSLLSS
jgi:hypothetical protein